MARRRVSSVPRGGFMFSRLPNLTSRCALVLVQRDRGTSASANLSPRGGDDALVFPVSVIRIFRESQNRRQVIL